MRPSSGLLCLAASAQPSARLCAEKPLSDQGQLQAVIRGIEHALHSASPDTAHAVLMSVFSSGALHVHSQQRGSAALRSRWQRSPPSRHSPATQAVLQLTLPQSSSAVTPLQVADQTGGASNASLSFTV